MESEASEGPSPFKTQESLLMIHDGETEWPTFESILREVREEHVADLAARKAAAADLLVAEHTTDQVPVQDIVVEDLEVENVVVEQDVIEHVAVVEQSAEPVTVAGEFVAEEIDFVPQDEPVIETTPSEYIAEPSPVSEIAVEEISGNPTSEYEVESFAPATPLDEPTHGIAEEIDFVPQDEPVIETTPSEYIAEPSPVSEIATPDSFTDAVSQDVVSEGPAVESPIAEEALNPFDPNFEGIAEDVVEDEEGWVTHSMSGIEPTPPDQLQALPEEEELTPLLPFEPIEEPTEPIITDEAAVSFGTFEEETSVEESYDATDLWDLDQEDDQDAVVIPFRQAEEPETVMTFVGLDEDLPEEKTETANTFALRPNVFTTGDVDPEDPQPSTTTEELFPGETPPPPAGGIPVPDPSTAPTPGVKPEDPWSTMRPKAEPEKITFWENRPKFFGGDERRKAKARREAAAAEDALVDQMAAEKSCPNCGAQCRVDVHDKALNRLHISCNSCRHMWVEDGI